MLIWVCVLLCLQNLTEESWNEMMYRARLLSVEAHGVVLPRLILSYTLTYDIDVVYVYVACLSIGVCFSESVCQKKQF